MFNLLILILLILLLILNFLLYKKLMIMSLFFNHFKLMY